MKGPEENPTVPKNEQYNEISTKYTELVKSDPAKHFIQYPSAVRLLGDISEKEVLDVGCGSGIFDRELTEMGAKVTAYDISSEQIANAKAAQESEPAKVNFLVSNPQEFRSDKLFDKAVSVLVLHYAPDKEYLEKFFSSTAQALKDNGEFVCILWNPSFKRLGETVYNRRFHRIGNGKMSVDFLDKKQEVSFSAEYTDFSVDDYEQAALSAGFQRIEWIQLKPDQAGIDQMGEDYWKDFEEDSPYIGFIAHK